MKQENHIPCGICIVIPDSNLTVESANDRAYEILGYNQSQTVGQVLSLCDVILEEDFSELHTAVMQNIARGTEESGHEMRVYGQRKEPVWIKMRCYYQTNDPCRLVCAFENVTAYKTTIEAYEKERLDLFTALCQAGVYVAYYDLANHTVILSESAARLFHLPTVTEHVPESLLNGHYMAQEDEERISRFFDRMREGLPASSASVQIDLHTGEELWLRGHYSLTYNARQEADKSIIIFEDITAQRKQEISYRQWYQLFERQVMESMIYYEYNLSKNQLLSLRGRVPVELPPELEKTFTNIATYTADNFVHPQDRESYLKAFDRGRILENFQKGQQEFRFEYRRVVQGHQNIWVMATIHTMQELGSDDIKCHVLIKDIDSQKRKYLDLTEKSRKDSLTHVFNRGMGTEIMIRMLHKHPDESALFFIMDIDKFKDINDTKGHMIGDEALKKIAAVLSGMVRKKDIICRFGGDEFVVFLRNLPDNQDASQLGTVIGRRMNQYIKDSCGITVSIGGAVYPRHGKTLEELYNHADAMLYEVKHRGGDWCIIYDDTQPGPETQKEQQKLYMDRYRDILSDGYDELLEYNVTTGHYKRLYYGAKRYISFQPEGDDFKEAVTKFASEGVHPDDASRFRNFCSTEATRNRFKMGEQQILGEFRVKFFNSGYGWVSITVRPALNLSEDEVWLYSISDIDIRKMAEEVEEKNQEIQKKQMEAERYQIIMEQTGTIVIDYDFAAAMSYMADGARQFTFSENIEQGQFKYFINRDDVYYKDWDRLVLMFKEIHSGGHQGNTVIRLKKKDGAYLWCKFSLTLRRNEDGSMARAVITINDVDEAMKDKSSLAYKEEYDELTGYPNFNRFKREAVQILASRGDQNYVLWYLNIKNFKLVNDLYGYDAGNNLLYLIAKTIADGLDAEETFSRNNSDHYTVLKKYRTPEDLNTWFDEFIKKTGQFGRIANSRIALEVTGGAYLVAPDKQIPKLDEMIERANIAQNSAKSAEGSRYLVYSAEQRRELLYKKKIGYEMEQALADKEFKIYLQPIAQIVDAQTFQVFSAEVLVRWKHADGSLRMPMDFIPLFEENGFIVDLDYYMMEETCAYICEHRDQIPKDFRFCVNVSRVSLLQDDFIDKFARIKETYQIPDWMIVLECTETTAAKNIQLLDSISRELQKKGFYFSLDDFGAGYSSLNILKDIHADTVKLDRIFLLNGLDDKRNRIIVSSIIHMARELGMNVLAEGVETAKQLRQLAELDCDWVQGYYLSRPVPANQFWELCFPQ